MWRITGRGTALSAVVLGGMLVGILPGRLHAGQPGAPAMPVPPLGSQSTPVTRPEEPGGGLRIWLQAGRIGERRGMYPPAELLLTDPSGRKLTKDPRVQRVYRKGIAKPYNEDVGIDEPGTKERAPQVVEINIGNPVSGTYQLEVIGFTKGKYDLGIEGYDRMLNGSGEDFSEVPIKKGEVHTYVIKYSSEVGAETEVTRRP